MRQGILLVVLWLAMVLRVDGAVAPNCAVCKRQITERIYLFSSAYLPDKQPVCGTCAELETTCSVCTLPIAGRAYKIGDGRFLCERDGKECVLTDDALQEIFADVKRDIFKMLAGLGPLPDKNVTVQLAGRNDLDRLTRTQRFPHERNLTMGVTQSRSRKGQFEHQIHILIGLPRGRAAAVCAHEYTHAWLQENLVEGRRLEVDTVEGFCELVAYKLMSDRNDQIEKKIILENSYTSGQVHSLVKAEDRYRFYEVAKWIKSGVDEKIEQSNTGRVLVRKQDEPAIAATWQPVKPTVVPETLVLRGISGTAQRRFALINDATLEKNERAKVRIGTTNVMVQCIDILEKSVVLSVNGSAERTELFLKKPAEAAPQ